MDTSGKCTFYYWIIEQRDLFEYAAGLVGKNYAELYLLNVCAEDNYLKTSSFCRTNPSNKNVYPFFLLDLLDKGSVR